MKTASGVWMAGIVLLMGQQPCGSSVDDDGDGYSEAEGDCDDTNASVYPSAPELCDGLDNNCDGLIQEDCGGGFQNLEYDDYASIMVFDPLEPEGEFTNEVSYVGEFDNMEEVVLETASVSNQASYFASGSSSSILVFVAGGATTHRVDNSYDVLATGDAQTIVTFQLHEQQDVLLSADASFTQTGEVESLGLDVQLLGNDLAFMSSVTGTLQQVFSLQPGEYALVFASSHVVNVPALAEGEQSAGVEGRVELTFVDLE